MNLANTLNRGLQDPFWCVAFLRWIPQTKKWEKGFSYRHAVDKQMAHKEFLASYVFDMFGNQIALIEIIGIAEVVGYHVDDEHGEKLSV